MVTLKNWFILPWRTNGEWKEFHLVAEPVVREIALGTERSICGFITARRWGHPSRRSRATRSDFDRHQQAPGQRSIARHAHGRRRRTTYPIIQVQIASRTTRWYRGAVHL